VTGEFDDEATDPNPFEKQLEGLREELRRHGKQLGELLARVEKLASEVLELRAGQGRDHAQTRRVRGRMRNAARHLEAAARELDDAGTTAPPTTAPSPKPTKSG
jgi:type II secretory pathway component PulM